MNLSEFNQKLKELDDCINNNIGINKFSISVDKILCTYENREFKTQEDILYVKSYNDNWFTVGKIVNDRIHASDLSESGYLCLSNFIHLVNVAIVNVQAKILKERSDDIKEMFEYTLPYPILMIALNKTLVKLDEMQFSI